MTFQENLKSIQEAYEGIISEAITPKFKEGDKVGVGSYGTYGYHPHDTGIVAKVNKFGHHDIQFDNRKNADDGITPYMEKFDGNGNSRKQYSNQTIVPIDQHQEHIKNTADHNERAADMQKIIEHISTKRNGLGQYNKLDVGIAEHLKSLIDKHTEK